MKDVVFTGSSLDDLRHFPNKARQRAGFEIDAIQRGLEPINWKPMKTIGVGVREIRIQFQGQYRIIYMAHFEDTVYVLHAFRKKTQKTPQKEIELARKRCQAAINERQQR